MIAYCVIVVAKTDENPAAVSISIRQVTVDPHNEDEIMCNLYDGYRVESPDIKLGMELL